MPKPTRNKTQTLPYVMASQAPPGSPLRFMLDVMNDETVNPVRRDRMAIAAAQYLHQRAADARRGKNEVKNDEAQDAGLASEWRDDLTFRQ